MQPGKVLHRENLTTADSSVPTMLSSGLDPGGFSYVAIDAILASGTSGVGLEVHVWSDGAQKFVPAIPALVTTGLGATSSWAVEVLGRRFWVKLTAISGATPRVDIYASVLEARR
jgi:hypothetical protein